MKIVVDRDVFTDKTTLGHMTIDGLMFGYTCEDVDRRLEDNPDQEIIRGQTAIPRGIYKIILSFSHRFQRIMPEILDVSGFTGIRIHGGNGPDDTEGCVLLGKSRLYDTGTAGCKERNKMLIEKLEEAEERGEYSTIEIK